LRALAAGSRKGEGPHVSVRAHRIGNHDRRSRDRTEGTPHAEG
jgi:hypothetical protein